jgi:predicted metal-dependent hydrolase
MAKLPEYTLVRSHRKTIALYIHPDGSLVVKAPLLVFQRTIDRFVEEHSAWIEQRLKLVEQRKPKVVTRKYVNGETFLYLGNEYILDIGQYKEIAAKDGKLQFPDFLQFRIKKELTDWYIRQARKIITEQVELYAKEMKASYLDLTFSDTKSQWGRCTHDNRLQFSWRLVMAPMLTLNYVVVHELAHTFQKNHAAGFWGKVRFYNPTYRQQRKWLEVHGHTLIV